MKAVETNVLIRFLTGDDERQSEEAYTLFGDAELERKQFFVPLVVVLESVYEVSRTEILEAKKDILLMPILNFDRQSAVGS